MKNIKYIFNIVLLVVFMVILVESFMHRSRLKHYLRYELFSPVCDKKYELNSKEYWDCRFKSQDWQKHHGDEQTKHFYTLLINNLPDFLLDEIQSGNNKLVDFGCAQGEGTELIAYNFPNIQITGVDISEEGIEIAKRKNHKAKFLATDLTQYDGQWDILISSNTMEHFYNPWEIIEQLAPRAKKYMIILVPFDQPGIPNHEHFYSFNYSNIVDKIGDFNLVYSRIANPDPKYWPEKQILLIYKKS